MSLVVVVLVVVGMAVGVVRGALRPYHVRPGACMVVYRRLNRRMAGGNVTTARLRLLKRLHDDGRMRGPPVRIKELRQVFACLV